MAEDKNDIHVLAIIDDHAWDTARKRLSESMQDAEGIRFHGFVASGLEGTKQAQEQHIDVLLVDVNPTDTDFIAIGKHLKRAHPACKVVLLRSGNNATITRKAKKANIKAFIQKPIDPQDALAVIRNVIHE